MTDGGIESTDAGATADEDLPVGVHVIDRDADDPNTAVVVDRPDEPAYERTIESLDGDPSVADLNPDYPASGPVVTVAYAGNLDDALDVWRSADPEALAGICDDEGVRTYDFPTGRVREVGDE